MCSCYSAIYGVVTNHATQFGKIKMKKIKKYFTSLIIQMRRSDDIRQIQDAIMTVNSLIEQNESINADTTRTAMNLVSFLEYDLENVTKEKH